MFRVAATIHTLDNGGVTCPVKSGIGEAIVRQNLKKKMSSASQVICHLKFAQYQAGLALWP
jgi:hypothetical protein